MKHKNWPSIERRVYLYKVLIIKYFKFVFLKPQLHQKQIPKSKIQTKFVAMLFNESGSTKSKIQTASNHLPKRFPN